VSEANVERANASGGSQIVGGAAAIA